MNHFVPGVTAPSPTASAWWFIFADDRLLVSLSAETAAVPYLDTAETLGLSLIRHQFLGYLNEQPCFSAEVLADTVAPAGMQFQGLRRLWEKLDETVFAIAGRAVQIVTWDRTHQFCGRCGSPTINKSDERAKLCPQCGLTNFPRLSPAIIVAITQEDKILLARNERFPSGYFSVIAGFVEPGESLEECVQREVFEETGIYVANIRYFGSQPWPFPHSLMIGFTATYAGGDISTDGTEIVEARWFTAQELPLIPGKISISRQLIDWFVAQNNA